MEIIIYWCFVVLCVIGGILTPAVMVKLLMDYLDKRGYLRKNNKE